MFTATLNSRLTGYSLDHMDDEACDKAKLTIVLKVFFCDKVSGYIQALLLSIACLRWVVCTRAAFDCKLVL